MSNDSANDLLIGLLSEFRAEAQLDRQNIGTSVAAIQASLAALQVRGEATTQQLAEMRAENRAELHATNARLSEIERQAQAIPRTSERLNQLEERIGTVSAVGDRRHQEVEGRLRVLEGDSRETGVFRRAAANLAGSLVRWALPLAGAALAGWLAAQRSVG